MMHLRTRTISALGVVQIFAWGTTYYLIAPLSGAIGAQTGWSQALLASGISVALLLSGFAAPVVGHWITRTGGRITLSIGMILIAFGLAVLGLAQTPIIYLLAWAILGLGMACSLYDAAFSVIGAAYGRDARSAITQLTLWGGFASTVCWPLSAWLVDSIGWRGTCFAYAALHLFGTLPLCWWFLPRAPVVDVPLEHDELKVTVLPVGALDIRFLCIVAAGITLTSLVTIWSVHMVTLLTASGYSVAAAIGLGALIGPSQVGARVLEMLGRGRHHPIWTMSAATSLVLAGFAGLHFGLPAAAALIAYGAGNGLWSIARGAVPLALFGPKGYPVLMGRLARPMLFAAAGAPFVGAFMIEGFGAERTITIIALIAAVPTVATMILFARTSRERRRLFV